MKMPMPIPDITRGSSGPGAGGGLTHLPTTSRLIMQENLCLLRRRWQLAKAMSAGTGSKTDRTDQTPWLWSMLAGMEADTLSTIAATGVPIFSVPFRDLMTLDPELGSIDASWAGSDEPGGAAELFAALIARLEAVRTEPVEAAIRFGLERQQLAWLDRQTTYELGGVARAALVGVRIGVREEWFQHVIASDLNQRTRAQLAILSRTH